MANRDTESQGEEKKTKDEDNNFLYFLLGHDL